MSRGDLDRTLAIAEDIVRRFVIEQLLPVKSRTGSGKNDVAAAFWRDCGYVDNDWRGLTRQLLAGAVSDGVLTPLEDDTRGITLQVGELVAFQGPPPRLNWICAIRDVSVRIAQLVQLLQRMF